MSNPYEATSQSTTAAAPSQIRMKLRRVSVMSVAMFGAAAGALMGILVGGFAFLLSMVGVGIGGGNPGFAELGAGAGMLIFAPLLYGFMGFIGGLINAAVYNIVASMSGGIEMEFSRS